MYKLTTTYDGNPVPHSIFSFADALDAFESFAKCVDWGFADNYATYNLSLPDGKMYSKSFSRDGKIWGK